MIEWYLIGALIAFLIGVFKVIISISMLFSIRARNLKKVGLFYSCFRGTFIVGKPSKLNFPFYLLYMLVIAPVFSWLSVISATRGYISAWANKVQIPERIKEIQYKIATMDLPKEAMIEVQNDLSKILGVNIPVFTGQQDDEEDGNSLTLEHDEDTDRTLDLDPVKHIYSIRFRMMGSFRSNSIYEYKFDGNKVLVRLLEDSSDSLGCEKSFEVKDNVVIESEVRKQKLDGESDKYIEEELSRLKQEVEWHEVRDYKTRFFIMSRHPDVFPTFEYRKAIRTELDRLETGTHKIIQLAKDIGAVVKEHKEGYTIQHPENCDDNKKEENVPNLVEI